MTETLQIEKIVCPGCCGVLDVADNFCRHCGTAVGNVKSAAAAPSRPAAERPKWAENRWIILFMLFLVLGPLGLPMLWRSRQFSLPWKIVLTVTVVGLTVLILWLIWYVLAKSLEPLMELQKYQGI